MVRTVWKYEWKLPLDKGVFEMPVGAEILCAREQGETVFIWARVDPFAPNEFRRFRLCGTGHDTPEGKYIGTASLGQGSLILHVFED